jgi:hypothetical protein
MPTKPADSPLPASPACTVSDAPGQKPPLPEAAQRALAEATARRSERQHNNDDSSKSQSKEIAGRGGLVPTRYGDWEVNGLASDF